MKLKERDLNLQTPEPRIANSRPLLKVISKKLGGGVKYSRVNQENCLSVDKSPATENRRSYSIFSTRSGSPAKEEVTERAQCLMPVFAAWKEFVSHKMQAWGYLRFEINAMTKKIRHARSYTLKIKRKMIELKVFSAWKQAVKKPKGFKKIFMKKFVKGWRKFVDDRKKAYKNTYLLQEKNLGRLEKQHFAAWRRVYSRQCKLKKTLKIITRTFHRYCFGVLRSTTLSKTFQRSQKLSCLRSIFLHNLHSQKSSAFRSWHRYTSRLCSISLKSSKALYESKISDLLKQIVSLNQTLAKERNLNQEREVSIKTMLKTHADNLYADLCNK